MEKVNAKRKASKQARPNKDQPIKVVYISNPIKVEASPANFREVVQELTGQDSDVTNMFDNPSTSGTVESSGTYAAGGASVDLAVADNESTVDFPFDMFDHAFTSQILEDFRRISQPDYLPFQPSKQLGHRNSHFISDRVKVLQPVIPKDAGARFTV